MVNQINLLGRVGKDIEFVQLDSGNSVAKFSLAMSEKFTTKSGEKKEETLWMNIEIWGKLGEIANTYVKKGDLLYVSGKLKMDQVEKDGVKKQYYKVVASEMKMLGSKNSEEPKQHSSMGAVSNSQHSNVEDDGDPLPF
jgi:single-strand DNA-binding protein